MANLNNVIEQSVEQTIQSIPQNPEGNIFLVNWMSRAGLSLSPWWSTARDLQLRDFWKKSDHLSGALYTMESKMTAIPFQVLPKDRSNKDDIIKAQMLTDILWSASEFGGGWVSFYEKFNEELLSQDNGVFVEIIGEGDPAGPIVGQPISVAHLDSSRCTRTGSALYPVIYEDISGKRYKLHFTRVMYASQMSSPIADMFGVGFCAISRALNVAQTLIDILVYKQEKLGSRPHRQIIITRGGLDPNDLSTAFQLAESKMDQSGLTRYSKIVVGGSSSIPDAGLDVVELSKMPDGFNEETSITLGMATIALAFGVDARELFPSMGAGSSRADALLQHLKQRGKGPGQILQTTEQLFNYKFLPERFTMNFDFQDDAEDRQRAEIRKIRSERRVQDMSTGTVSERILREQMVEDGEVSQEQFERMELESGRLPDGNSSLILFYSKNQSIKKLLNLGSGISDPLDVKNNNIDEVLVAIGEKRRESMEVMANSSSEQERWSARMANSALVQLEQVYVPIYPGISGTEDGTSGNYIDPRTRNQGLESPTDGDREYEGTQSDTSNVPYEDRPEE